MAECTVAILRKGTTIVNIVDAMKAKYTNVDTSSSFEDFFKVTFNDGQEKRSMSVSLSDSCYHDYGISGTWISLGNYGNSVEIIKYLCETFGGYFKENDCGIPDFEPINLELFLQGEDFTVRDKFIQEIIAELGYSNLKKALVIFDKYIK